MLSTSEKNHVRQLFQQGTDKEFPQPALELIYDKQLFRLFIPRQLGGRQCSIPEAMHIIQHCAQVDGDFGWAVQIGAGGGFFAGFFQDEVAQKYFTKPKFVIAGSGFPGGQSHREKGHFRVNGQWKYASGCGYATLITANTFVDGSDQIRACAFLPEQVQILDDWDAYGMRHTLSHSVKVENAQVPEHMTFDVSKLVNNYDYKLYNFPFMIFARSCILSSLSGCFSHLLEEVENHINTAQLTPEKLELLKELYSDISGSFEEIQERTRAAATKAWELTSLKKAAPDDLVQEFDAAMRSQIEFITRGAYRIFNAVGMPATVRSSQLNKVWRDLTTAAQHVVLK